MKSARKTSSFFEVTTLLICFTLFTNIWHITRFCFWFNHMLLKVAPCLLWAKETSGILIECLIFKFFSCLDYSLNPEFPTIAVPNYEPVISCSISNLRFWSPNAKGNATCGTVDSSSLQIRKEKRLTIREKALLSPQDDRILKLNKKQLILLMIKQKP